MNVLPWIILIFEAGWVSSRLVSRIVRGHRQGLSVRQSIVPQRGERAPKNTEVV